MMRWRQLISTLIAVCFAYLIYIVGLGVGAHKYNISYYAAFENGDTVKVDSIIAVPISSTEQISRMWPEYHAETIIDIEGKKVLLRSKPFLFCDNPEIAGRYEKRDVYCPD